MKLQKQIIETLKQNPQGLTIHEIRSNLGLQPGEQENLSRRVRDLTRYYTLQRGYQEGRYVYKLGDLKSKFLYGPISNKLRTKILIKYNSTCQLCGRNVQEDGIKLHVDHKTPLSSGGKNKEENLWCLCSECNEGKKDELYDLRDTK